MKRRTEPSVPSSSPAASPTPAPGRHGFAKLVLSAIEDGTLAQLPGSRGLDPCDIVEASVPAMTLGDLGVDDATWAGQHIQSCRDCRNLLSQSHRLDALLGQGTARLADDQVKTVQDPGPVRPASVRAGNRATVWSMETPIGDLFVAVSDRGVCEIDFAATTDATTILTRLRARGFSPDAIVGGRRDGDAMISGRLVDYLSGKRRTLDLSYDLASVTPFTRQVLASATEIPFGSVATYGAVAARIGQPTASRAIGNALGRNPVPLLIPCHRVVRSDLTAGGFVGGTAIKQRLLELEGATFNRSNVLSR